MICVYFGICIYTGNLHTGSLARGKYILHVFLNNEAFNSDETVLGRTAPLCVPLAPVKL